MFCTKKFYSDTETNANKSVKAQKLAVSSHRSFYNTRYKGYFYYHGCSILILSLTNRQVGIHGVGRVRNINYLSKEGIPNFELSENSCS